MTINGAIMELVMLRENPDMPYYLKASLDKVIETISEAELVEPKDEPQTENLFTDKDGDVWEWRGDAWYCISGDEPQTDCAWKNECK